MMSGRYLVGQFLVSFHRRRFVLLLKLAEGELEVGKRQRPSRRVQDQCVCPGV